LAATGCRLDLDVIEKAFNRFGSELARTTARRLFGGDRSIGGNRRRRSPLRVHGVWDNRGHMELDYATVRKALRMQCGAVSRLLLNLPEQKFALPTRLQPWDILHLVAHLYRDFERVPLALREPQPAKRADTDVVTYWQYDRTENASRTQARADLIVGNYASPAALARAFDAIQRQAISLFDKTDPDVVVRTWEPIMRVDDFAATRVVEVTIHGLDLARALERPPGTDDNATAITSDVLSALLAAPLPQELTWDTTIWIEKASGRISLTPGERTVLRRLAEAFPLFA